MTDKLERFFEDAIVGRLITGLIDNGYRIEISDQDGGGLYVYATANGGKKPHDGYRYWVRLAPGDGMHVISDYTTNLRDIIKPIEQFMDVAKMAAEYAVTTSEAIRNKALEGIYVASKTKHAWMWRDLRERGFPISSTWIDEAGEGETSDFADLWRRCLRESANCRAMLVYCEPSDVLKGAWLEMGVALNAGVPVFGVGLEPFTIAKSGLVTLCPTVDHALAAIRALRTQGGE